MATTLGIRDTRFSINDKPVFLLGISYYAGLAASDETAARDLDEAKRFGFNWIRVWANWAAFDHDVSAVDVEGKPRPKYLSRLEQLVARCDRLGLVVDVTLSRGNGVTGPPRLQTLEAHRRAVEVIVPALKNYRNWYFDLANERSLRDKRFVPFEELKELRAVTRRLDSDLLVTASHSPDIDRDDLRSYLQTADVDFICPHRARNAASAAQTESKTREYLGWMKEGGRIVPVHYQEPFRRGFGNWQPEAGDYRTDLQGAIAGGAAGWCFHNGDQRDRSDARAADEGRRSDDGRPRRSFDLREQPLFEQIDPEEYKALEAIRALSMP